MVLNLWVATPMGIISQIACLSAIYMIHNRICNRVITVAKLQLLSSNEILLWLGLPQHEEVYQRVTVSGRLRTPGLKFQSLLPPPRSMKRLR